MNKNFSLRIAEIEMSVRAKNALRNENVITVKDLVQKKESDVRKIPNLGQVTLNEIKEILAIMGLYLEMDVSPISESEYDSVIEMMQTTMKFVVELHTKVDRLIEMTGEKK
jgi:DNA-directed RNA polymerase alpha subunit